MRQWQTILIVIVLQLSVGRVRSVKRQHCIHHMHRAGPGALPRSRRGGWHPPHARHRPGWQCGNAHSVAVHMRRLWLPEGCAQSRPAAGRSFSGGSMAVASRGSDARTQTCGARYNTIFSASRLRWAGPLSRRRPRPRRRPAPWERMVLNKIDSRPGVQRCCCWPLPSRSTPRSAAGDGMSLPMQLWPVSRQCIVPTVKRCRATSPGEGRVHETLQASTSSGCKAIVHTSVDVVRQQ